MRRGLTWIAGALGLAALYRVLSRQRRLSAVTPQPAPAVDPAEELRRKLAESREVVEEREEFESAETPVDQADSAAGEVEKRRRRVHKQGRAAAEEMRGPTSIE